MDDVFIKSGEQPKYFTYGGDSTGGTPSVTTLSGASTPGVLASNPNAQPQDSPFATLQVISAAAATVIFEGTNEAASAQNVLATGLPAKNNWCPVTGTASSSTVTLSAAGTGAIILSGVPWRWIRARIIAATAPTQCILGV